MRFDRYLKGLHAKFIALVCLTLLLMLAVVVLMLQRQSAMQHEVVRQSRDSMHALVFERLRVHGEALSAQVADTLVNPLYYFDLDTIGVVARNVLRQPDVRYVLVYDNNGAIIHDGSGDIPTYGQAMRDPLAYEAVSAPGVHAQWTDRVLEVSSPIKVGDERLGGVRIGYSLDGVRADEMRASTELGRRIGASVMQANLEAAYRRRVTRRYLDLPVAWHQRHATGTQTVRYRSLDHGCYDHTLSAVNGVYTKDFYRC